MKDYERAAWRLFGWVLVAAAGVVGAATCGDQYGRDHAVRAP